MSDYRKLNPVSKKKFKRRLEFESSGVSHIQDAVLKTLYEDELDLAGEYHGVVLAVLDDSASITIGDIWSRAKELGGFKPDYKSYKIRVEPVHDMIPMPEGPEDCIVINMHHTFVEPILAFQADLVPGDIVVVSFLDGSGILNPKVVSRTPKSDSAIANWTKKVKGSVPHETNVAEANITKPQGDEIGSGKKCMNKQIPTIHNKVDKDKYSKDKVLRWLPLVKGVRKDLESKYGISLSFVTDLQMIAMIRLESNGDPRVYNGKKHYGLLQQQDSFVYDAYQKSPGNKISLAYPASNYGGKRKLHQKTRKGKKTLMKKARDAGQLPDNEDIIRDQQLAALWNIQTAFLYFHRYRSRLTSEHYTIAILQKGGTGTARQIKKIREEQGISSEEATKINDKRPGTVTTWPYVRDHYLPKYNEMKQKMNGYDPNATEITREDCEPEFLLVGPEQPDEEFQVFGPEQPDDVGPTSEEILQKLVAEFQSEGLEDFSLEDAEVVAPILAPGGKINYSEIREINNKKVDFKTFKPLMYDDERPYNKENVFSKMFKRALKKQ